MSDYLLANYSHEYENEFMYLMIETSMGTKFDNNDKLPKCLVMVGGKPIIQWQIEVLEKLNVKELEIVVGTSVVALVQSTVGSIKTTINIHYYPIDDMEFLHNGVALKKSTNIIVKMKRVSSLIGNGINLPCPSSVSQFGKLINHKIRDIFDKADIKREQPIVFDNEMLGNYLGIFGDKLNDVTQYILNIITPDKILLSQTKNKSNKILENHCNSPIIHSLDIDTLKTETNKEEIIQNENISFVSFDNQEIFFNNECPINNGSINIITAFPYSNWQIPYTAFINNTTQQLPSLSSSGLI
ncbi:hypothetical protein EDI_216340 [Entamoeba dispar SAW760]|uniref:Uncharacterized protein n=1 Tax=Entamoeba dispar (strain ATCC PRA-260 / SAW760) TaxID=370354 RepID=B0EKS5_ENTDS|nr:uncharacterized protein EDI_216340 [Entamoeba dispar SAW760]EDR24845.1 hypothetical protein EDI_216340 [Entamoeba dispar SAW760]|eukprot:EDR24845.1 hypothetical protein EDI_216340 [Entamoeba dispar SAW760]